LNIRTATPADLDRINEIISDAIGAWQVADRVRQLSRHAFRYDESDLEDGEIRLLIEPSGQALAVSHWSVATLADKPADSINPAILHSLYVLSAQHRQGLGQRLLHDSIERVIQAGHDALTVRAQRDAEGFFFSQGFQPIAGEPSPPLYPRRLSKRLRPA